jgi:outer membrane protein OmpA-like peptidoglycan-associated protein
MSQSHRCKQFIQMALMALWMSTVCVNPILAAELEVDELIDGIRNHILTAEKRAKEQPLFGVKEVKLTISYAVEKKGEGGFKAFVITAGTSVGSHAVQTMEIILTPLKEMKVEEQKPEERVEKFVDLRRSYTTEDLVAALLADSSYTRGIPKLEKTALALNIFFPHSSSRIPPKYYSDLDKLGEALKLPQFKDYRFQIEGHTDNVGSQSYNENLSEKRAESVKQYLVQHFSIDPQRLIARGYGERKPRGPNDTDAGRYLNRRIEIVNLGKG